MDGFDCVREETGSSVTIYHIPDGMLHSFSLDGAVFQCHADALSSIRMITDASGAVVARLEYGAWGEELFVSAIPALANFPYRFVGALGCRTDLETGLVYCRHRWYSPELQRFISRDPIGLAGGPNSYIYGGNSPVNFTDPSGLAPVVPPPVVAPPAPPIQFAPPPTTTVTNPLPAPGGGAALARAGLYGIGGYLIYQMIQSSLDFEEADRQARDAQIAEEVTKLRQQAKWRRRRTSPPTNCPREDIYDKCREKCLKLWNTDRRKLPGSGRDYSVRIQRCIQECLDES